MSNDIINILFQLLSTQGGGANITMVYLGRHPFYDNLELFIVPFILLLRPLLILPPLGCPFFPFLALQLLISFLLFLLLCLGRLGGGSISEKMLPSSKLKTTN